MKNSFYINIGKRFFDIAIVSTFALLWVPLLVLLAVLVRWRLGAPVLFQQQRPGLGGRLFTMYKFRTMTDQRDASGNLLPDEYRLTTFGKFLRSASLDELPELWNVLRGEMSLVGPRPLLSKYLELYTTCQARRHEVPPGITGWAQVNGRNALEWEKKFELDVWYVDHCGFWLDVRILLYSVIAVAARRDVQAADHATSPEFLGTPCTEAPLTAAPQDGGIIVIGGGGHAKVVIATLQACGHQVVAVFDDNPQLWGQTIANVPIEGPLDRLLAGPPGRAVIAVGDNRIRRELAARLRMNWISVVHPTAHVDHSVKIGEGSVVFAGAIVQPGATVGQHVIINTLSSVDHDCSLGDFSHVGPGSHLAGDVEVKTGVFLGAGSVVIPGKMIGDNTIVGAGTVVIRDLPADVVAVGSPARILKSPPNVRAA